MDDENGRIIPPVSVVLQLLVCINDFFAVCLAPAHILTAPDAAVWIRLLVINDPVTPYFASRLEPSALCHLPGGNRFPPVLSGILSK